MISTHILDTSLGSPAEGIPVTLELEKNGEFVPVGSGTTNSDGRLVFDCEKIAGTYRLRFEVENYLEKTSNTPFFTEIPVVFRVLTIDRKYHVPLLLNPFGYSTYRGS